MTIRKIVSGMRELWCIIAVPFRTQKNNDKEIDFVVQKPNNEREYYQIAFTVNDEKTFEREISAFRNIRDNYPKFLLTLDFDNTNIEGIHKVNIIDWLLGASHSP